MSQNKTYRIAADVSMCTNSTCSKRDQCLRYMATPNERQVFTQYEPSNGQCRDFKPLDGHMCGKRWLETEKP